MFVRSNFKVLISYKGSGDWLGIGGCKADLLRIIFQRGSVSFENLKAY